MMHLRSKGICTSAMLEQTFVSLSFLFSFQGIDARSFFDN